MRDTKILPGFADRQKTADEAKKALLAKFKPKVAVIDPDHEKRELIRAQEKEAIRKAHAEAKEAARLALLEAEEAARIAAEEAEEAARVAALEAEQTTDEQKRKERKERKAQIKADARARKEMRR